MGTKWQVFTVILAFIIVNEFGVLTVCGPCDNIATERKAANGSTGMSSLGCYG